MKLHTMFCLLAALAASPFAARADQGGKLIGTHEIPAFVLQRITLPAGAPVECPQNADPSQHLRPGLTGPRVATPHVEGASADSSELCQDGPLQ